MLSHQERLRAWEAREAKRANDYENYATKEKRRQEEQEREARKLKEFLEDYDDERDDAKFYRGRELQRRLADRYVSFLAPTRSSRKANVRPFVSSFGSSLSRAINLHNFGSNFQADFKGIS